MASAQRANPIRLAIAGGTTPEALRRVNSYLGEAHAREGIGFSIVRNGRGIASEIVLHPGMNPDATGAVLEELATRHIITESEKTSKLKLLSGTEQSKTATPAVTEADPERFSVNGHRYRLDMRESMADSNTGQYVAELVPIDKVSAQELIADTQKVKGILSHGRPQGSLANIKDVSEGYVFSDNGDVRAQGANQFYISSELSPDSILESLPREDSTVAPPRVHRVTKAEGFNVSVGGTVIASEEARGMYRSANGYSLEDAIRVVTGPTPLPGVAAIERTAPPSVLAGNGSQTSIRAGGDAISSGTPTARPDSLPVTGIQESASTFHIVDAKTSMAMTRAAMLRQALYAARNLMDGNLQGAAQKYAYGEVHG